MVCAVRGYRCILTMPAAMSLERRQLLEAFGAECVLTPEERQIEGAIERAAEIARSIGERSSPGSSTTRRTPGFIPRRRPRRSSKRWRACRSTPSSPVSGRAGRSAAWVRCSAQRSSKTANRRRRAGLERDDLAGRAGPHEDPGARGGFVPGNYHASVVDEVRTVADDDAWAMKELLARKEGLLLGISAGAAVVVAREVARELGPGKNVVTVLPDTGERYFSLAEYFRGER